MKEKTTDEKVYETLCAKFDQMVNESEDTELFNKMYEEGIRFAEDLAKNKYWKIFTERILTMEAYNKHSKAWSDIKTEPVYEYHWEWIDSRFCDGHDVKELVGYKHFFTVKADNFEARFPIIYLCNYIKTFKQLSHHRGKHEIDYSMSPAYESIYALQTA